MASVDLFLTEQGTVRRRERTKAAPGVHVESYATVASGVRYRLDPRSGRTNADGLEVGERGEASYWLRVLAATDIARDDLFDTADGRTVEVVAVRPAGGGVPLVNTPSLVCDVEEVQRGT